LIAVTRSLRRRVSDRGAAAVEMAFMLPLLLFVVFGIIDYGRMLNAQITLTEAAREGARAAALGQSATTRVNNASSNLTGVTTTVTSCPTNPTATSDATVTTSYTFQFVTPVPGLATIFGGTSSGSKTLTGTGVVPCLG
jgi:Flp pilus assembly protein TadG